MQIDITSFWYWHQHFSDVKTCFQAIIKLWRPEEFCYQHSGLQKGCLLRTCHVYHCGESQHQTSAMVCTFFNITTLQLFKWFLTIYRCRRSSALWFVDCHVQDVRSIS